MPGIVEVTMSSAVTRAGPSDRTRVVNVYETLSAQLLPVLSQSDRYEPEPEPSGRIVMPRQCPPQEPASGDDVIGREEGQPFGVDGDGVVVG